MKKTTSPAEQPGAPAAAVWLMDRRRLILWLFLLPVALILCADLVSKKLVFDRLVEPIPADAWRAGDYRLEAAVMGAETVVVIPGLFNLRPSLNTGAVFGIGQGKAHLFALFTLVATAGILYIVWTHGPTSRLLTVALALIQAGALGNLYDRLAFGCVRDFLDFYLNQSHWPAFNIADCGVTLGAALVVIHSFLPGRKKD